ncbi:LysM peptidoglycan-binding domain-containing protein [bacterium]|nr:LysM peptidoglycan-binding domain-containing protein [bacterium]MCI0602551.1 LysM peptidoglycan-binding domain-containing protein [bacterium]
MKKLYLFSLTCLICLVGLWGCGSSRKTVVLSKPAQNTGTVVSKPNATPVEAAITSARHHFFLGERELNLGHLEKAKAEFDASLDVLMKYQSEHAPDSRVEAVIDELQEKIFQHEIAALKAGDGFTEHPLEPALIDELKNIDTFPAPDQETKKEVEKELKSVGYDIPVEVNDSVLSFIRIFQNSRRKEFVGGLVRSGRYLPMMKRIFREQGLPEDLVYTALIESSFKSNAYSRARAKGFWQFISGTAKRYDLRMDWWVDQRSDFERSTYAATEYLRDLHGMFGDWYLALAGYNAGENKVAYGLRQSGAQNFWQLARTRYIRQETKNYVPAILAAMIIAKDPEKYGFYEQLELPLEFDTVPVDYTVDLRLVAECSGVSLEEIYMLNPELTRLTTPSNMNYVLRVPKDKKDTYLTEIAAIPTEKRVTWRKHEVRPGETIGSIAAIYRTSESSIASVNSFSAGYDITAGQKLVIPIGRSNPVRYEPKKSYSSYGQQKYYRVRKGDTLFKIASKHGITVQQLSAWNNISSKHVLHTGESLVVHGIKTASKSSSRNSKRITYKVKKGDTLYKIASSYNTNVEDLVRWNKKARSGIYPGDRLTIYTK